MATKKPAAPVKAIVVPVTAAPKVTIEQKQEKARQRRLTKTPKGTARAKRRGSLKHFLVDPKAKSAKLASYGAKEEGMYLKFASSASDALQQCGIKVVEEVVEAPVKVKKPRAKKVVAVQATQYPSETPENHYPLAA